ncbi:hypothetical protein RV134_350448 [Roseovarius sp. EC-HK134]|nr:hypothetical protein RV420_410016 [Roseovarius sp. EC-SD190]VVT30077.1 hypothetical protein RV134_350448 [Roseovarius sp. EC-HK134]
MNRWRNAGNLLEIAHVKFEFCTTSGHSERVAPVFGGHAQDADHRLSGPLEWSGRIVGPAGIAGLSVVGGLAQPGGGRADGGAAIPGAARIL